MPKLLLASTSPARKKLLTEAGIAFETLAPGVDEDALVDQLSPNSAEELTLLLAKAKAEAVLGKTDLPLILGCDSALEFDGEIYGKPLVEAIAIERWRRMRGKTGSLLSGHHLIDAAGKSASLCTKTVVHFANLSDEEIEKYVATGEPLNVAGAFTIDSIGGSYIERIEGDYHTVVGLSLVALRQLMAELGYNYQDFWR
ncbi:MAG: septum formation inhibitor Maf [Actinomycetota bacterium]